jgi:hypothetical protein
VPPPAFPSPADMLIDPHSGLKRWPGTMLGNWVDALFNQSLDVFAKIGPGFVLLVAVVAMLISPESTYFTGLQAGAWVAVLCMHYRIRDSVVR